jgi:hypothetical protein
MTGHKQPSNDRRANDQRAHTVHGSENDTALSSPDAPRLPDGSIVDRRTIPDRRELADKQASDDALSGLERRRGPGRRLSDFQRSAEEGELTAEQFLFVIAIDEFKKGNNKTFPTWTDVLEVIRLLGYRKTQPSELNLLRAEDWSEAADAPARVRPSRWQERFRGDEHREAA